MRALLQRVKQASVSIDGTVHGGIERGIVVFLGVTHQDTGADAKYLAQRCGDLRIFEDAEGKMNLSLKDVGGSALVISQFTLYADTHKGNRPSFTDAAPPGAAEILYNEFVTSLRAEVSLAKVHTGVFRARMDVGLVNDGPVTIMLETKK